MKGIANDEHGSPAIDATGHTDARLRFYLRQKSQIRPPLCREGATRQVGHQHKTHAARRGEVKALVLPNGRLEDQQQG
jgi:hypothetical protein